MKKVLVIAYYYPPLLDVGVQRTLRYVKHMRKYNWDPHILTVKNPDRHYCITGGGNAPYEYPVTRAYSLLNYSYFLGKFNGLIERIERCIPIIRLKHSLWESLAIPDRVSGWLLTAYLHGIRLLMKNKFDLIYVSVQPFGSALLAKWLSHMFNIPFVVDARDPLTCIIYEGKEPQTPRERFACKHEVEIVKKCARFVLTTHTAKKIYKSHYSEYCHKFDAVYNGFDATEDKQLPEFEPGKLNMIYVGNYYFDPSPILRVIKELRSDDPIIGKNIIFRHIGLGGENISRIAATMGIGDAVQILNQKSRPEMMAYIRASDVFFVRTQFPTNISAKMFDGLAVNMPILVTYAHDEIKALVESYASKYTLLSDESTYQLKAAIKKHYLEDRDSGPKDMNCKFIQDFSGENLTRKMCLILDDAIHCSSHPIYTK